MLLQQRILAEIWQSRSQDNAQIAVEWTSSLMTRRFTIFFNFEDELYFIE